MPERNIAVVMRALADPTRRAVFERVTNSAGITVVALTRDSGVSQPAVSQHLRALREAGLIVLRREGRNTHCEADPAGMAPLVDWLAIYGAFWRERFANLRELLKEIDP
jgi:DNA-binding transcriptional ArsR family regulator